MGAVYTNMGAVYTNMGAVYRIRLTYPKQPIG